MSVCEFLADWKTWKASGARSKANFSELSLVTEERILLPGGLLLPSFATILCLSLTNMLTRGRLLARKKQGKETSAFFLSFSLSLLSLSLSLSFSFCLFLYSAIRDRYRTRLVSLCANFRTNFTNECSRYLCAAPLDRRQGHP